MEKIKYNVVDDEGTLIDTVLEAPEHVGGNEDAIRTVSKTHGIEKSYLRAIAKFD
jgi:hypothetical protein